MFSKLRLIDSDVIGDILSDVEEALGVDANLRLGRLPGDFDLQGDSASRVFHSVMFLDQTTRVIEVIAPVSKIVSIAMVSGAVGAECFPMPSPEELSERIEALIRRSCLFDGKADILIFDSSLDSLGAADSRSQTWIFHLFGRLAIPLTADYVAARISAMEPVRCAVCEPVSHHFEHGLHAHVDDGASSKLMSRRLRARIEDVMEIPPLPATAAKVLKLRFNEQASVGEFVDIVQADPQLSAQMVSWASSPGFSSEQISTVSDAIGRVLGMGRALDMATALAIKDSISVPRQFHRFVSEVWSASFATAMLSESIAKRYNTTASAKVNAGECYLVGLLHHIGMIISITLMPEKMESLFKHRLINPSMDPFLLESHVIGVSSLSLASLLLHSWGLPEIIIDSILQCRRPLQFGRGNAIAEIVHIAIQELISVGRYPFYLCSQASDIAHDLRIDEKSIEAAVAELESKVDSIESFSRTIMNG